MFSPAPRCQQRPPGGGGGMLRAGTAAAWRRCAPPTLCVSFPPPPLFAELRDAARRFSRGGVSHYVTLTLDEAEALLYVGAREAVFALSTGTVELKAAVRLWGGGGVGGEGVSGAVWGQAFASPPFFPPFLPLLPFRSPGKPPWRRKRSASRRAKTTRCGSGGAEGPIGDVGCPPFAPPPH